MEHFNAAEAASALKYIFRSGDVFEIRALDAQTTSYSRPHTVSGYFDYEHIDAAVKLLARDIRFARGIYYTPNPVNGALLARACNRLRDMGPRDTGTADKDIPRRRWLLIDCDAVRPSGISSSDAEHAAAEAKALEIRDGLASMGFPDPVRIDSGNGAQLMYRIDLGGGDEICKGILQQLQACNSDAVEVDETVFNAARIWRLPGSVNCKGDPIPERPHREARILEKPETPEIVPEEVLKRAAGIREEEAFDAEEFRKHVLCVQQTGAKLPRVDYSRIPSATAEPFELERWIALHCPDAEGPEVWQDGRKWILPVCPFNPEHANRSAVITEQASGAVGFKCHHNGCKDKDWHALRALLDPEFAERGAEVPEEPYAAPQPSQTPMPEVTEEEEEDAVPEEPAPWRDVTNDQIQGVLEGTHLGEMTELYASVTVPELPVEAALLKSIVTFGCALSGPGVPDVTQQGLLPPIGAQRARLRINTAGGQVCNVYALLAANSASGKDIGNILDTVTTAKGWNMGTSGSAEGIAEALKNCPNGLISISEFMNWLDEKHWQHKATSFLTEAFSKGYFRHNFSSRSGKGGTSSCDYCYPNIIANIQPEVFEAIVRTQDIASGFMGRFLYAKMPEFFGDPARVNISSVLQQFAAILPILEKKHGTVEAPEGYGNGLSRMFKAHSAPKLHPVWRRLVNEYMPRLAVMLSVDCTLKSQGEFVLLKDKHWHDAELLVQWFFAHAERMLSQIEDETQAAKIQEKIMRRLAAIIARHDKGDGVNARIISQKALHTGTTAMQRRQLLQEMAERGWIVSSDEAFGRGARFKIARLPPGILD